MSDLLKNEPENIITIRIKNKHDTETNLKFTGVSINIEGPPSVSENNITPGESEKLYLDLCKDFFAPNKKVLMYFKNKKKLSE